MKNIRRRAQRSALKAARAQRHQAEVLYVEKKATMKGGVGVQTVEAQAKLAVTNPFMQKVLERDDRRMEYLSRESLFFKTDRNQYSYPAFFGKSGDDEWARVLADKYSPDYLKIYTQVTFGTPSIGTIIKHLKRFDGPDLPFCSVALPYWVDSQKHVKRNEWNGVRQPWSGFSPLGLSEESLPSFPGIYYRHLNFKDKASAETSMMIDAVRAVNEIVEGKYVRSRPVALFGRGKRVSGDDAAGLVGQLKAGRLVMAVDGREHCMIAPLAEAIFDSHKSNQLTTEIVVGMSFQNRGTTKFLYNFVCDMEHRNGQRLPFMDWSPSLRMVQYMDDVIDQFVAEREQSFRFFVLDLSRQDSSIGTFLYDAFFEWVRYCHKPTSKDYYRDFGRYTRWVNEFLVHTRIAMPDGQIWIKHKGNVSGSPLTTLVNSYTALCAARCVVGFLSPDMLQSDITVRVYGDNILIAVPKEQTLAWGIPELCEVWEDMFGQLINPDESYEAQHLFHEFWRPEPQLSVSFLSKHFLRGGGVWRPESDTIAQMIAPDGRQRDDATRYARACGLMIDNPFNVASIYYLNGILNTLEDKGVMRGCVSTAGFRKWKYKLMDDNLSDFGSRMSVLNCQMLYELTGAQRGETGLRHRGIDEVLDAWAARLLKFGEPL